ncbi:MAG: hypothetical protein ACKOAD_02050, partial [Gammaproteobacteria bacterium]
KYRHPQGKESIWGMDGIFKAHYGDAYTEALRFSKAPVEYTGQYAVTKSGLGLEPRPEPWIVQTHWNDFDFIKDLLQQRGYYFQIRALDHQFLIQPQGPALGFSEQAIQSIAYLPDQGMGNQSFHAYGFEYRIINGQSCLEIITNQPIFLGEEVCIKNLPFGDYKGIVLEATHSAQTNLSIPDQLSQGPDGLEGLSPALYECRALLSPQILPEKLDLQNFNQTRHFLARVEKTGDSPYPDLNQKGEQVLRLNFDDKNQEGQASYRIPKLSHQAKAGLGVYTPLPTSTCIALGMIDGQSPSACILGTVFNPEPVTRKNPQDYCLETWGGNQFLFQQNLKALGIHLHTPGKTQSISLVNSEKPFFKFQTQLGHLKISSGENTYLETGFSWTASILENMQTKIQGEIQITYTTGSFEHENIKLFSVQMDNLIFFKNLENQILSAAEKIEIQNNTDLTVNTAKHFTILSKQTVKIRTHFGHFQSKEQLQLSTGKSGIQLRKATLNLETRNFNCTAPNIYVYFPNDTHAS